MRKAGRKHVGNCGASETGMWREGREGTGMAGSVQKDSRVGRGWSEGVRLERGGEAGARG